MILGDRPILFILSMQVLMSTLWIAIDTDYNKEDSEYGKVFVMVDNVICVPRFGSSIRILRWHVAHQVWLAFSVSKIQSEVYGVCLCAYSIHQLSRKQVSPKQYLICNLLHSDALIHDDLTMDSIVFALSWSSNSLALSLFIFALEVCCLFPLQKRDGALDSVQ